MGIRITRIVIKSILSLYYFLRFKKARLAFYLSNNNIHPRKAKYIVLAQGSLHFKETGNIVPLQYIYTFGGQSLHYLIDIFNYVKIEKIDERDGQLIISANGINFNISTESGAGNFYEIICRNTYSFCSPARKLVALDIGMNMSLASLYFASQKNISRVYAFEPFPETVEKARKNLALNPELAEKIIVNNRGISNYTDRIKVPQFEPGSMEASTNQEFIRAHQFSDLKKEQFIEIEIADITETLQEIIQKENITDRSLVLKIDCEGEEYNIFEKLDQQKFFDHITVFLVEWHHKGPDRINEILTRNGFTTYFIPVTTIDGSLITEAGMIYAFRS